MIINKDFTHQIIIHASGEFQIRLLHLIFASVNEHEKVSFCINSGLMWNKGFKEINNHLIRWFRDCKSDNIKPQLLYVPKVNQLSWDKGTIYTKQKLDRYYATKQSSLLKGDYFIENISKKIELANYRLINMKELIDLYGKYLFKDNNHKEEFLNKYSVLSNCNIYKTLKNINI